MAEEINKHNEYKQRQREWRDITVNQLSNVNTVLLTLSSGLFVWLLENNKSLIKCTHIDFKESIHSNSFTFSLTITFLAFSILHGIAVLFSRLYDFRISRHLALTRQRFYFRHKKLLPFNNYGDFNFCDRLHALFNILFYKVDFIIPKEIAVALQESKIPEKFSNLQKVSSILGTASWRWLKIQTFLFLLSGLLYFVHQLLS